MYFFPLKFDHDTLSFRHQVSSNDINSVASIISIANQVCPGALMLLYTLDLSQSQLDQVCKGLINSLATSIVITNDKY